MAARRLAAISSLEGGAEGAAGAAVLKKPEEGVAVLAVASL